MISNVFFDLDGTLADPKESILLSFQYALECLGHPPIANERIFEFIGPPLRLSFAKVLSAGDKALVEKAVRLFRERFSRAGLAEYDLYPGIKTLLSDLSRKSYNLWVVTAKPQIYADKIIRQLGMGHRFGGVFGPDLDGQLDDKSELVAHVIGHLNLIPSSIAMVGDRRDDIIAGKTNGTLTIAVTYGFGSREEIADSAPDYICQRPSDILRVLTQTESLEPNRSARSKNSGRHL